MKLSWYVNRLRNMEPAEIAHRLVEKARKLASKKRHQGWSGAGNPTLHPVFPNLPSRVLAASPGQRRAVAEAAADFLAGRYAALGRQWPERDPGALFPPELWRLDPVTQALWPDSATYAFDIDFRHDGSRGDVKYVWEINRLQFLPVLAAHHLLQDDEASLGTIEAALISWHDANPPYGGVAWASGIEVALRAISIMLTLDMLGHRLSDNFRSKAGEILSASAFWLPRFPSRFSSANNHLVAELAGEYLLAISLGHDADRPWQDLLAELDKQILPDGSGAEQTPTYAAFTAELVLLSAMAARDAGTPLPQQAGQRLAAFADFIAWLGTGEFGDNDEGRVVTLGAEADYASSVAAAIAGFLGAPSPVAAPDDFRGLVFGTPSDPLPHPSGLHGFADGGLSVWRGDIAGRQVALRFDHGPLGYLSIAAHGHADALSLTLDIDGEPILVDPGTYLYGSGGVWREWFRSTPAHNTLNLGGQSQSTMSGAFNWSHKATARRLDHPPTQDWLTAEHDGYERRFGARHQRQVRWDGGSITVHDRLIGTAQPAEIVFQLASGLDVERDGNVVTASRNGISVMRITLPSDSVTIASGGEFPGSGGWVSPRFGIKLPAPRIAWRGRVDAAGVASVLTVLQH
ncbi:heparinase II/III-family protein [Devosia oryziradicis]|uniref:Heparinase II/III-family protein n=1 Tax=Devosia oryziradicis TaxID=2801335 RepID=A0ABX7BYR3_9HYPH|nr:heparinase II/III-family protein [Devosia oryziradicis]QQR37110.1 heparinase II/III-family protein [Devosia oryziradicis]